MSLHPLTQKVLDDMAAAMSVAAERMKEKDARIAELEAQLGRVEAHPIIRWRGSVTDLVTDISALLTLEQLAELAGEAALAWRLRKIVGAR